MSFPALRPPDAPAARRLFLRRLRFLLLTMAGASLLAALYGAAHDQLTYSLSPEYYTRFKFIQFGFADATRPNPRLYAALVGVGATWWVGAIVGFFQGCAALALWPAPPPGRVGRALLLTLLTAMAGGVAGFLYGRFHLVATGVS